MEALTSMTTLITANFFQSMLDKAFSTHPSPWTAFTEGPYLSFAARSVENVF